MFVSLTDEMHREQNNEEIASGYKLRVHEGKLHVAFVTLSAVRGGNVVPNSDVKFLPF